MGMLCRRKLIPEVHVFHPQMVVVSLQFPVLFSYVQQNEVVLEETNGVAAHSLHNSCHWRNRANRPHSDQALIAIGLYLVSEVEKLSEYDDQQNRQIAIAVEERFH